MSCLVRHSHKWSHNFTFLAQELFPGLNWSRYSDGAFALVLSSSDQPCAPARLRVRAALSLKPCAPVGVAWRDWSRAGWGDRPSQEEEMFWLWLSARYAGIQAAQHVGEITGGRVEEGGREGEEWVSQTIHLLMQCDQAYTHVADNWSLSQLCTSVPYFIAVQFSSGMCRGQQTKHSPTLFPYPPSEASSPPPSSTFLPPPSIHHSDTHRHALQRMQRYRSYIEAAFQRSPHRVDDRVLLKRKKACGGRLQVWRGY